MVAGDAAPAARELGREFWHGKRVLVTGHSGFKGSWLVLWLGRLGAEVTGISLAPEGAPSLFGLARVDALCDSRYADIRDAQALAAAVHAASPQIVFHLAAQPLVRHGYREPLATFATNVQGTANLLDSLRGLDSVRAVVAVTTDKVYRNLETGRAYAEDDTLGGIDPYSASKAAAEIVIASYRDAFLREQGVALASARAGNVIGGGDWSPERLVPDAMRAWAQQRPLAVRRPGAVRPWQHVLEPLHGYLLLARELWMRPSLAGAFNFGPDPQEAATVREVIALAQRAYGHGEVSWIENDAGPHEAGLLALDPTKAKACLGMRSRWNLAQSVQRTVHWYREQLAGADARALCERDIAAYMAQPARNARPQAAAPSLIALAG